MRTQEKVNWKVNVRLEKRHGDINACKSPEERRRFLEETEPYDVVKSEGNLLLNEGINEMWDILCKTDISAHHRFTYANARIGVGNSSTAASADQTDLQGASKDYQGMESGYPQHGTAQKAVFKSSWGDADGNFAWNEWTIDNGATGLKNLNRKVESLGTKTTGTWTLEVSVTLA